MVEVDPEGVCGFAKLVGIPPTSTPATDPVLSPVLEEVWDEARFPLISRYEFLHEEEASAYGNEYFLGEALASFEFGLARVLEGIDNFVHGRSLETNS